MIFTFDFEFEREVPLVEGRPAIGTYRIPEYRTTDRVVCVELGSSVGGFITEFHKRFDHIFSFEACYSSFLTTLRTVQEKEIANCTVFNLAAHGTTGELVKIKYPRGRQNPATQNNCSIYYYDDDNDVYYHNVMTINLADIHQLTNTQRIHYLKVDIEGCEYDFLYKRDLRNIDAMGIEIHDFESERSQQLFGYLSEHFHVSTQRLRTHSQFTLVNKCLPEDYLVVEPG